MAEFPIVGIGSSAGGLEALQVLFGAMPPDGGLGFVVAAHLDPTHESHLGELLSRRTKMPVVQIESSIEVEPDHVYVIAPDQELTIRQGVILTSKPTDPRGHWHPIDKFFRFLAEDQQERAVAIVLSGTGTNGSLGVRAIKSEGGVVIAQDPETAGFPAMPRSAIATGIVDLVLAPERMPEALLGLRRRPYPRQPLRAPDQLETDHRPGGLLAVLRARAGQDFSPYRKQMLLRRLQRQMGLHRLEDPTGYVERLRTDREESAALTRELTIDATGFFRDPEAWQVLDRTVITPLVRERPAGSPIRVWVPGCASGEEAYSIAMLITERAETAGKSFDLKVFATDAAGDVLSAARAGRYPGSIAPDVGRERLERFFEIEGGACCIGKTLREMVTFAPHDLLRDPPFARNDLIGCRNLLVRLKPEVQRKVLALFHFALRADGHLFLGPGETAGAQEDLFQSVSRKWRIYRRLGPSRHEVVDFPVAALSAGPAAADVLPDAAPPPRGPGEILDHALLERYAPASALIDRQCRVHYLHGPTDGYLRPPRGEPSYNLFALAREGLQPTLEATVRKAIEQGREVAADGQVRRGGALHPVRVVVAPLVKRRAGEDRMLVSFFDRPSESEAGAAVAANALSPEPAATREDVRTGQMNDANEELQASNEKIRLINEELQASMEELETSKEELQSLNEELTTVNLQLQARLEELEVRTGDLRNLLSCSEIATLFLDRNLCVRWFTPAIRTLLDLLPTDIGRPVSHFAQKFSGGNLVDDIKGVLADLARTDAEVLSDQDRWYIRRIVPYRTEDDRIDGVVVTFVDITERKGAEDALAAELRAMTRLHELGGLAVRSSDLQTLLEGILDATIELHRADFGNIQLYDANARTLRIAAQRGFRQAFLDHLMEVDVEEGSSCGVALARGERVVIEDVKTEPACAPDRAAAREGGYRAVQSTPLLTPAGAPLGLLSTHFRERRRFAERELRLTDLYARQAAEALAAERLQRSLRASEERFRQFAENSREVLWIAKPQMAGLEYLSPAYEQVWGAPRDATMADLGHWAELVHPDDRERVSEAMPKMLEGKPTTIEYRIRRPSDGKIRWIRDTGFPIHDQRGRVHHAAGIARDVTDEKRAAEELRAAHERISDILESITDGFYAVDEDWRLTFVNRRVEELWGRSRADLLGRRLWDLFPNVDLEATEGYRLHLKAARERRPVREEYKSHVFGFWVNVSIYPQQDGGLSVAFRDISDRRRAEEGRELLARELSHRVKNVLAVVQSLAMQTDGRFQSVDAFRQSFVGRLQALARAHSVLLEANWQSADLRTLIQQAVAAYRVDHPEVVELEGDPVAITPRQGLGLSLVLHEAGTNASKYGALSRPEGRLRISWQIERDDRGRRLRLQWRERNGPRAEPPGETGFGTKLIQRACSYELDGEVELDYAPEGLTCEITFPLA